MRRFSEIVLDGHPDKFCDHIAEQVVRTAYGIDPEAYAQIEVSVWSDQLFLTGAVVTREPFRTDIRELVIRTGDEIGYTPDNHIDVRRYVLHDHICKITGDPRKWTCYSNDQSIVCGWAGYDAATGYMPPEHYLCWRLRDAVEEALEHGTLKGHGPDGKILVIMKEEGRSWQVETILVTLQQRESASFISFTTDLSAFLPEAYRVIRAEDPRWTVAPEAVRYLVNPNGPLLNGGSDGDNGQTGRKLVMDYYGPRVPIGGGALYGKDLSHIDRLGAMNARRLCVDLVKKGAKEAFVNVSFAPGMADPLSVSLSCDRHPGVDLSSFFGFQQMHERMQSDRRWHVRDIR